MALSLDDLKPVELVAKCNTIQGREVKVAFITLTWNQWDALGREVSDPDVPYTSLAEDGVTKLPNRNDVLYLEKLSRARDDRQARRLFASLEGVSPDNEYRLEVEGETPLQKWDALHAQGDRLLVQQLIDIIAAAQVQGRPELEQLAKSFRPERLSPDGDADLPADAVDTPTVE